MCVFLKTCTECEVYACACITLNRGVPRRHSGSQCSCNNNQLSRTMNVEHEVQLLVEEIKRLGTPDAEGKICVKFGVLFNDDRCANIFEALVGTLKAAKRKKIIMYEAELLLQNVHDNVDIILLKPE